MKVLGYEEIVRYVVELDTADVKRLQTVGALSPNAGDDGEPVILPITLDELTLTAEALGLPREAIGRLVASLADLRPMTIISGWKRQDG